MKIKNLIFNIKTKFEHKNNQESLCYKTYESYYNEILEKKDYFEKVIALMSVE